MQTNVWLIFVHLHLHISHALHAETCAHWCSILVEHSPDEQLRMLAAVPLPPALGEPLPAFFGGWLEHALDTAGEFALRLCALAVARLLCSRHPTLQAIQARAR
jgi:hypothetical protein